MRLVRILLSSVLVTALFLALIVPGVALADQSDPDSVPAPVVTNAYRNLIETGDQLYLIYANIPYGSIPDALVTEAFFWQLIDTDGSTVIGTTTGTPFNDSGYGYNVFSMYFSADNAPTWDQVYTIRLSGNPSIFDDPPAFDFILGTGDFSGLTETIGVKSELALRILVIAGDLQIRWGLDADTTLVNAQETGTVLSARGETFFRGAIFGLQAMAPGVFQIGVGTITATDREWETEYTANITTQYTGTWVETSQTAGATFFNKSYDLVSLIFLLVILAAIVIAHVSVLKTTVWSGMIDVVLVAVIFARLGIPAILLTFMGLVGAMCWIYISAKVWGVVR